MQLQVLRALHFKNPGISIDVLVHEENQPAHFYFLREGFNLIHFPRSKLQSYFNDRSQSVLEPLWLIEEWSEAHVIHKYDLSLNLTHNKLSAYLHSLFWSQTQIGLHYVESHFSLQGPAEVKEFNTKFSDPRAKTKHYIEMLGDFVKVHPPLLAPKTKVLERIYLQAFTSDEKKDWPLECWKGLFDLIKRQMPKIELQVLGSPSHLTKLRTYFGEDEVNSCSLEELSASWKDKSLLISSDTSLIHLAALDQVPSLMISLGSSDPHKTSAYLRDCAVISPEVPCRPCSHGEGCRFTSYLCKEDLMPKHVYRTLQGLIEGFSSNEVLCDFGPNIKVYRTSQKGNSLTLEPAPFYFPTKTFKEIL